MRYTPLLLAVVLPAAAAPQQNPIISMEGPFLPGAHCPPADGYEWKKTLEPSSLVYWAVPRNDREVIGVEAGAVTYRVGTVSIIYARVSRDMVSEGLREHEECHAAGWMHGEAPIGGGMFR